MQRSIDKAMPITLDEDQIKRVLAGELVEIRRSIENPPQGEAVVGIKTSICKAYGQDVYQFMTTDAERRLVGEPFSCPYTSNDPTDTEDVSNNTYHDYYLWVQEPWRVNGWDGEEALISVDYQTEHEALDSSDSIWLTPATGYEYNMLVDESLEDCAKSNTKKSDYGYEWVAGNSPCRWREAKTMPRWASRIILDMISIGIESVVSPEFEVSAEWVMTIKQLQADISSQKNHFYSGFLF